MNTDRRGGRGGEKKKIIEKNGEKALNIVKIKAIGCRFAFRQKRGKRRMRLNRL